MDLVSHARVLGRKQVSALPCTPVSSVWSSEVSSTFSFCPECGAKNVQLRPYCNDCGFGDAASKWHRPLPVAGSPQAPDPSARSEGTEAKNSAWGVAEIIFWIAAVLAGLFAVEGLFDEIHVNYGFVKYNCGTAFSAMTSDPPDVCTNDSAFRAARTSFGMGAIGAFVFGTVAVVCGEKKDLTGTGT